MPIITVWKFAEALIDAGILTKEQVNRTTRIVIDADPKNGTVLLYFQQYADERLLSVLPMLTGIEVKVVESIPRSCDTEGPHEAPYGCTVIQVTEDQVADAIQREQERYGEKEAEGQQEATQPG